MTVPSSEVIGKPMTKRAGIPFARAIDMKSEWKSVQLPGFDVAGALGVAVAPARDRLVVLHRGQEVVVDRVRLVDRRRLPGRDFVRELPHARRERRELVGLQRAVSSAFDACVSAGRVMVTSLRVPRKAQLTMKSPAGGWSIVVYA